MDRRLAVSRVPVLVIILFLSLPRKARELDWEVNIKWGVQHKLLHCILLAGCLAAE